MDNNQISVQDRLKFLNEKIKKKLPKSRYNHSVGVAFTASSMAMRYGEDIYDALIAGLMHDCAKAYTGEELLKICKKNDIKPSPAEQSTPNLLHAKVGSILAKEKYGIEDAKILDAIAYHTTGRPDMTLLEKIIFIADYIEPARKPIPNLENVRSLAFADIDRCIVSVCEGTLQHLKNANAEIDSATVETYEYYRNMIGE